MRKKTSKKKQKTQGIVFWFGLGKTWRVKPAFVLLLSTFTVAGSLAALKRLNVCFHWQGCSVYWPEHWSEHLDTWSLFPAVPLLCWVTEPAPLCLCAACSSPMGFLSSSQLVMTWRKHFQEIVIHALSSTAYSYLPICGCFKHTSSSSSNRNDDALNRCDTMQADLQTKQKVWPTALFHCA